jgi:uncharacterized protein YcaQ
MDPLRAPARAQDLILRHRVTGYRAGDLDRAYATLPLAEEFVHVHGVIPATLRRLLHPRPAQVWHVEREHPGLAERVLAFIGERGPAHPRDLHAAFGRMGVRNGWGGQSAATTRVLEALHYRGALRVARRDDGIRVYGLAERIDRPLAPATRFARVLALLLRLYAPLPLATLRDLARMASDGALDDAARERVLDAFAAGSRVRRTRVDGVEYLRPDAEVQPATERFAAATETPDGEPVVRLVAPFDPIVWDRRRFAHLHGWEYRFEAYTPAAKRRFGYYALPLMYRDAVIGWANVTRTPGGVDVATGFAARRPRERAFTRALDAEIARLAAFLPPPAAART